jgi:hypothetical protein
LFDDIRGHRRLLGSRFWWGGRVVTYVDEEPVITSPNWDSELRAMARLLGYLAPLLTIDISLLACVWWSYVVVTAMYPNGTQFLHIDNQFLV